MLNRTEPIPTQRSPRTDFAIGEWVVSPSRNSLRRKGETASRTIEPLLIRFLSALAARGGNTATKDELIEEVWDGLIVSDEAMAQAASRLRRALGDDPRDPRYIETVRKVGYRLVRPVEDWIENGGSRRRRRLYPWVAAAAILFAFAAAMVIFADNRSFELKSVAVDVRDERKPAISPDGRQLAYEVVNPGGTTAIWVSGADGENAAVLPGTEGGEAPVWLSNRALAMQFRNGPACVVQRYELATRSPRTIARCDGSGYADLAAAPDGRRVAFNAFGPSRSGPRAIHIVDIGGRARRVTAPPPESWGDYDPEFSPDGSSLLFVRAASEGQQDLFLVDPAGHERRLTRRFGNIHGATWSGPEEIVYAARNGSRYELRRLNLTSSRDRPLPLPAFDLVHPVVRDDVFLVESRRFQTRLVATGIASAAANLRNSSGLNLHPALSPNGRQAAFLSDRSGSLELWLVTLESGELRQLTQHRGPFVGAPKFAPDGKTIVYEVRHGDDSDIYALDVASGASRPLVSGQHFDTAPSVSSDGRRLYFASDRGSGWNVYSLDLAQGGRPSLLLSDAFAAIEAPDGSALHFTRRSVPGLFRRDGRTGRVSTVDDRLAVEDWGAFSPVTGGVVFIERTGPGLAKIVFVSNGGERQTLGTPAGRVPSHDPVLSARAGLGQILHVEAYAGAADIYRVSR